VSKAVSGGVCGGQKAEPAANATVADVMEKDLAGRLAYGRRNSIGALNVTAAEMFVRYASAIHAP